MISILPLMFGLIAVSSAHTLYTVFPAASASTVHITPPASHSSSSVSVNTPHVNYKYDLAESKHHGVVSYNHHVAPAAVRTLSYLVPHPQVNHVQPHQYTYAHLPQTRAIQYPKYGYSYVHPATYYYGSPYPTIL